MPNINKINCRTEGSIEACVFIFLMFSQSLTANNIVVFEDLNIKQMGIKKTGAQ